MMSTLSKVLRVTVFGAFVAFADIDFRNNPNNQNVEDYQGPIYITVYQLNGKIVDRFQIHSDDLESFHESEYYRKFQEGVYIIQQVYGSTSKTFLQKKSF